MVAEASKLLKGVDVIALHLAKTALSSDAIVSEAPNVGKLSLILLELCPTLVGKSSGGARYVLENLRIVPYTYQKIFGWCSIRIVKSSGGAR